MSEENDAEARKHRYESLLRTVEHQTGGPNSPNPQRAGASASSVIVTTCSHGEWDADLMRRSLRAAVENGDLIKWYEGTTVRVARTDEESIREVVAEQNQSADPNTSLIERAISAKGE